MKLPQLDAELWDVSALLPGVVTCRFGEPDPGPHMQAAALRARQPFPKARRQAAGNPALAAEPAAAGHPGSDVVTHPTTVRATTLSVLLFNFTMRQTFVTHVEYTAFQTL